MTNEVRRTEPPGAESTPAPGTTNRRAFIGLLGLSAGTVAVAAAGGLAWRAVDGGVFATGTGPAYDAWEAPLVGHGLIASAILASNAHNTQPWTFAVGSDTIDVFADMTRTIGAIDPLGREMAISHGAAVENLVLAGPANGVNAKVTWNPTTDSTHVARLDLSPTSEPVPELFAQIPRRHTNRGAYDTSRAVSGETYAELAVLVDHPDVDLIWLTSLADRKAFSDLTIAATEEVIADDQQSQDDAFWYRTDWQEIQERKDGVTIDPSGQPPFIRAVSKIVPTTRAQNNAGWLRGTRDIQLPTAAAFGLLVVRDRLDQLQRWEAGRAWQRIHLAATARGLGMQPLCQVLERIDRESATGQAPATAEAMAGLVPSGWHPVMTFRTGFPTIDAPPSPRRPAADVTTRA